MSIPPPTFEELLERFEALMQHVADLHASEFIGVDVTMPQAKVLYVVSLRPGVPMSALAGELGIGLSALSGLVERLVSGGYLERREDPSDRRQHLVVATRAGEAALDRIRELRGELMRRLLAGFSPTELDAFGIALAALEREVRAVDPTPVQAARHERTPA